MGLKFALALVPLVVVATSGALACDDYADEMALAAAREAAGARHAEAPKPLGAGDAAAAALPSQSEAAVAAAAPKPAEPQATANLAGSVNR